MLMWLTEKIAALKKQGALKAKPWLKKIPRNSRIEIRFNPQAHLFDKDVISLARLFVSPKDNPSISFNFMFVMMIGQMYFDGQFNRETIGKNHLLRGIELNINIVSMGDGEYFAILNVIDQVSSATIATFSSVALTVYEREEPIYPKSNLIFVKV